MTKIFTDGSTLTAEDVNEYLNEGLLSAVAYTPTLLVNSGSAPAPASAVGAYVEIGALVVWTATISLGSSGYGTGTLYRITLPPPEASEVRWSGDGIFRDASNNRSYPISWERLDVGPGVLLRVDPSVAGGELRSMTPTLPVAWGNGDTITVYGYYLKAAA